MVHSLVLTRSSSTSSIYYLSLTPLLGGPYYTAASHNALRQTTGSRVVSAGFVSAWSCVCKALLKKGGENQKIDSSRVDTATQSLCAVTRDKCTHLMHDAHSTAQCLTLIQGMCCENHSHPIPSRTPRFCCADDKVPHCSTGPRVLRGTAHQGQPATLYLTSGLPTPYLH
jgi:hypothetical protein